MAHKRERERQVAPSEDYSFSDGGLISIATLDGFYGLSPQVEAGQSAAENIAKKSKTVDENNIERLWEECLTEQEQDSIRREMENWETWQSGSGGSQTKLRSALRKGTRSIDSVNPTGIEPPDGEMVGCEDWVVEKAKAKASVRLNALLLRNIKDQGWMKPTLVQEEVIPLAISTRRDVTIAAETGSGKTAAFVLPILQSILDAWSVREMTESERSVLNALILVPTHELATQIKKCIDSLSKDTGIRTVCIIGGIFLDKQTRLLAKKPHIVVGSVGRLAALTFGDLSRNVWAHSHLQSFSTLRFIVLDEADRLLEPGKVKAVRNFFDKITQDGAAKKCRIMVSSATLMIPPARNRDKKDAEKLPIEVIPFRSPKLLVVDLSSKLAKVGVNQKDSAMPASNPHPKLPKGLTLALCRVEPCDKDWVLFLTISRMCHALKAGGGNLGQMKILVFANSIDAVKRIRNLLTVIFNADRRRLDIAEEKKKVGDKKEENDDEEEADSLSDDCEKVFEEISSPSAPIAGRGLLGLQRIKERRKQTEKAVVLETFRDETTTSVETRGRRRALPGTPYLDVKVFCISSAMKQRDRLGVLEKFAALDSSPSVLVATDVAARGIDFPAVNLIVHYSQPRTVTLLVHRCGRTARGAGKEGCAYFLMSREEEGFYCKQFREIGTNILRLTKLDFRVKLTKTHERLTKDIVRAAKCIESTSYKVNVVKKNYLAEKSLSEAAEIDFEAQGLEARLRKKNGLVSGTEIGRMLKSLNKVGYGW